MRPVRRRNSSLFPFVASIAVAFLAWEIVARSSGIPSFLLPSPEDVAGQLVRAWTVGELPRHIAATLVEILAGLALGLALALGLGYGLAKSPALERFVSPYLVASQSVPVVALAPLLVIWFGPGRMSKILICALIVFFPALVNTILGLRSVPPELRDLLRSLRASAFHTFTKLEVPAASPAVLSGLRVGATLSVIGAVVGEFVAAEEGLGFLLNVARGQYNTPLVFGCVLVLVGLALGLYGLTSLLEARLLRWRDGHSG